MTTALSVYEAKLPNFTTQLRGLDKNQVAGYIQELHEELEALKERIPALEGQLSEAQRDLASADDDRTRLRGEIEALRGDIARLSGPIDSVEGMSDRIARMMRVASDEARRTKAMAEEEAEALTRDLRDELEAARQDRAAATAALAELQESTSLRREQILTDAKAEAGELLRAAQGECARLISETEAAERARREAAQRLAEDDERRRRESEREQAKQVSAAWEQAQNQIANTEKDSRLKAAALIATAEREAKLIMERTDAEVMQLIHVRGDVVGALSEIQSRIESAIRRDRMSVVKRSAESDQA